MTTASFVWSVAMIFPRRTSPCVVVQEICAPRGRDLACGGLLLDTSAIFDQSHLPCSNIGRRGYGCGTCTLGSDRSASGDTIE